jgi:hypothetical protein
VHHGNGCPQADGTNQNWKAPKITVADDDDDDYKSAEESKEKALCSVSSTDEIEVTHSSTPGSRAMIVGADERKSDPKSNTSITYAFSRCSTAEQGFCELTTDGIQSLRGEQASSYPG